MSPTMSTVSDDHREQLFTDQAPALAGHPWFGYLATPVVLPEPVELSTTDPPGQLVMAELEWQGRRLVWGR
ncbi:hypothetical protein Pa4123_75640 [Phytohabitans aurantiacus]|uniref:Uncharacterized protein n=1 Tax=Phytohabitans aurantiacus TaxID=3016789 RepID=A0ABQ5R9N0_9ACTN|nr:hypothetical protein Pa4123_75640 [Phytohabitans aurantiacus]